MKVKELIRALKTCDMNSVVVMSSDAEGNSFSPFAEYTKGSFWKQDREFGSDELTPEDIRNGYTEEDLIKGGVKAVCLWPV